MEKQIKFTIESKKALHSLHIGSQKLIKSELKKLARGKIQGKPLTERLQGLNSLKIDNYRAIYGIEKGIIIVFDVGHRKSIYDKKE